jgi:hypothetical protein
LAQTIFPDWIVRVFHDKTVPSDQLKIFRTYKNVETVEITNPKLLVGNIRGMFWRFLAGEFDPDADIFLSRDSDSRLRYNHKKLKKKL